MIFFQAEDGIRDKLVTGVSDVCSSDLQLLSLRSRACEPQLLKPACLEPMLHNKRSHCNEKPVHRNEE